MAGKWFRKKRRSDKKKKGGTILLAGMILCFIMAALDYYHYGDFSHSLDVIADLARQLFWTVKNMLPI